MARMLRWRLENGGGCINIGWSGFGEGGWKVCMVESVLQIMEICNQVWGKNKASQSETAMQIQH